MSLFSSELRHPHDDDGHSFSTFQSYDRVRVSILTVQSINALRFIVQNSSNTDVYRDYYLL